MSKRNSSSRDPDIASAMKALRRAAKRALQIGIQTGTPVYVLKSGKVVDIAPGNKKRRRKIATPRKRQARRQPL